MSFHHDNDARQPTILTFSCGCGRLLQCAHSSPLSLAISPTQPDQGPRLPPARACLLLRRSSDAGIPTRTLHQPEQYGSAKGGWQKVTRLYRNQEIPEERCWIRGSGWCLAYS
jgi:hypothetical protein